MISSTFTQIFRFIAVLVLQIWKMLALAAATLHVRDGLEWVMAMWHEPKTALFCLQPVCVHAASSCMCHVCMPCAVLSCMQWMAWELWDGWRCNLCHVHTVSSCVHVIKGICKHTAKFLKDLSFIVFTINPPISQILLCYEGKRVWRAGDAIWRRCSVCVCTWHHSVCVHKASSFVCTW